MGRSERTDRRGMGAGSKERIVEKAVEMFACHGFAGTSVSTLCKEVGVAPTAIYWHFDSKAGLLAAALERAANRWIDQIGRSCAAAEAAEDQLARLVAGLRTLVTEHADELALIMGCFLQHAGEDPLVDDTLAAIEERSVKCLTEGLGRAIQVQAPGLELVAEMTLGMLDYITLDYRRVPDQDRLDKRLSHLQEMIVVGCCHAVNKLELEQATATDTPLEPSPSDGSDMPKRRDLP